MWWRFGRNRSDWVGWRQFKLITRDWSAHAISAFHFVRFPAAGKPAVPFRAADFAYVRFSPRRIIRREYGFRPTHGYARRLSRRDQTF